VPKLKIVRARQFGFKIKRPSKQQTWRILLFVVGLSLIIWGSLQFFHRHQAISGPAALDLKQTVTRSTNKPDEAKVDPKDPGYDVPPDQPKTIILPTLGVSGLIQKVGVDEQHRIAVPGNINVAGWYVNSVKPGQPGLSIIDGHVHGVYAPGIFEKLGQLKAGDPLAIEFGDGHTVKFTVVSREDMSAEDANQKIYHKDTPINAQLNLMTCSGTYDKGKAEYTNRLLVVAKPVS
jgi:sortase (surface protein transpeptidase)